MKAAMPRSLIPLMLFSLPIQPNHMFASRWLNSQFFNLGCTELYNDVVRFKQGVVITKDIDNNF